MLFRLWMMSELVLLGAARSVEIRNRGSRLVATIEFADHSAEAFLETDAANLADGELLSRFVKRAWSEAMRALGPGVPPATRVALGMLHTHVRKTLSFGYSDLVGGLTLSPKSLALAIDIISGFAEPQDHGVEAKTADLPIAEQVAVFEDLRHGHLTFRHVANGQRDASSLWQVDIEIGSAAKTFHFRDGFIADVVRLMLQMATVDAE